MADVTRIVLGVPGPSGSGITAAQWAALQAMVASDAAAGSKVILVAVDNASAFLVTQADGDRVFQVNTSAAPNPFVSFLNGTGARWYSDTTTEQFRIYGATGHILSSGTKPTIAAGAAAGTSPTVAIPHGTDTAGVISVTTGTGPTTGTLCTVTFANAYASTNFAVVLTPADADSAQKAANWFVDNTTKTNTTFKIEVTGAALTASTNYLWNYVIIDNP